MKNKLPDLNAPPPDNTRMSLIDIGRKIMVENKRILSSFPHSKKQLYFDKMLSVAFGRPVLDLPRFDDWIHDIYGEYEDEQGLSLYDLLAKEKGIAFAKYIEGLI
jgi:hypothetical protein